MRMSDFVVRESISANVVAATKETVIREMVENLRAAGYFKSNDGEPVFILFMLISPQERPSDHLRALEGVSRALRDDNFVRTLRQATTAQQIWDLIVEQ